MTKQSFLDQLRGRLAGLPLQDMQERLNFYSEMIDDRMDEGLSEEDAVAQIGTVDAVAAQILSETGGSAKKPTAFLIGRPMGGWSIALLILGFPLWLPLLAAGFSVALAVYAVIWSMIVSLWAVFGAMIGCAVGSVIAGIIFARTGNALPGVATIGAGILCAGLAIFLFYGCMAATKGTLLLTKKMALGIWNRLVRKEAAA